MGNCTGYCTGCKDGETITGSGGVIGGTRYDNAQVRQSYSQANQMMREGFGGEAYTGGGFENSDMITEGYSHQKRSMRKLGASADNSNGN